ncbi:MAG: putative sugar O-methyltransferase [Planctomycetes bacterium]|nr:putative sugar O-methyltransferase [Planctomycetota bacterium]
MEDNALIAKLEADIKYLNEFEKNRPHQDFGDWEDRFKSETAKLLNNDLTINTYNLRNFRGLQIFVSDWPCAKLKNFYHDSKLWFSLKHFINHFLGTQRGGIKEAMAGFKTIEEKNYIYWLEKYPSPEIGRPLHIHYRQYRFTRRYLWNIYLFALSIESLGKELEDAFIGMDIGCSYGTFSSLLKQAYPQSRHILVDMPGQLILAHYYLANFFPNAKIAGFSEVGEAKKIDREFVKKYDFVLLPTSMYSMIQADTVDLVTNFASLTEMSREWFDSYLTSPAFKSAQFFFTVNRYDASPTYQSGITILDYPLKEYEPVLMGTCPIFPYYYTRKFIFFDQRVMYPSQFFQFIGRRNGKH